MLVVAIFVILVLGMLAMNLMRVDWSNQDTLAQEYLGNQAWFVSYSGNEWAMTQLFPLNEDAEYANILSRCQGISSSGTPATSTNSAAAALVASGNIPCSSPTITCQSIPESPSANFPEQLRHFVVISRTICSSGKFEVERVQETWVKAISD